MVDADLRRAVVRAWLWRLQHAQELKSARERDARTIQVLQQKAGNASGSVTATAEEVLALQT